MSESQTADHPRWFPRRLRLTLFAVGLVALVVAGLLTPIPFIGRIGTALGDLAHAPLFGGIALGIFCLLDRFRPLPGPGVSLAVRSMLVLVGLFAFGVAIELTQQFFGRSAAVHDAVANGLGILAATFWVWARSFPPDRWWSPRILLSSAGFLLAIAWWNPLMILRDVVRVHWDFPMLASFESREELKRWYLRECEARLSRQDATSGNHSMEVIFQPTSYPGTTLVEMQSDWSAMKTLELDVVLDPSYSGRSVRFMLKVIDKLHQNNHEDAFRGTWTLEVGQPQRIRVTREEVVRGPDDRELDLSKVEAVDLLLLEPGETTKVRFDRLKLTLQ